MAGFSLIEVAIVLGIIGLVIGGIWAAASAARLRSEEQRFMAGLVQLIDNAQSVLPVTTPCGTILGYDPLWTDILRPKEWQDISGQLSSWAVSVECDVGYPQPALKLTSYNQNSYMCGAIVPRLSALAAPSQGTLAVYHSCGWGAVMAFYIGLTKP